jgi:hypothetical protein
LEAVFGKYYIISDILRKLGLCSIYINGDQITYRIGIMLHARFYPDQPTVGTGINKCGICRGTLNMIKPERSQVIGLICNRLFIKQHPVIIA